MEEEEEPFKVVVHSVGGADRFKFGGLEFIANELGEDFLRGEKLSYTAEDRWVEFGGYADESYTEPDATIILLFREEEDAVSEAIIASGSEFTVVNVDADFGRTFMNWLIHVIGSERESTGEESDQSYEYQPLEDVEEAEEVERIDDFSKLNILQATSQFVHRDQRIDESAAFLQALASSSDED